MPDNKICNDIIECLILRGIFDWKLQRKMRYRLDVEYDGSGFAGWQIQNNARTIQGEIERSLEIIFKKKIRITGAGRTDAGVHARGQVAHFDWPESIEYQKIFQSLNGILPEKICVKNLAPADADFHARYSAIAREYIYRIAKKPVAINRQYVWQYFADLNVESMECVLHLFAGKRNYQSFCRSIAEVTNYNCEVQDIEITETDNLLKIRIKADRFLHGMVRTITGTLVEVGRGKLEKNHIEKIFEAGDRRQAGMAAPAKGLTLEKVYYQSREGR